MSSALHQRKDPKTGRPEIYSALQYPQPRNVAKPSGVSVRNPVQSSMRVKTRDGKFVKKFTPLAQYDAGPSPEDLRKQNCRKVLESDKLFREGQKAPMRTSSAKNANRVRVPFEPPVTGPLNVLGGATRTGPPPAPSPCPSNLNIVTGSRSTEWKEVPKPQEEERDILGRPIVKKSPVPAPKTTHRDPQAVHEDMMYDHFGRLMARQPKEKKEPPTPKPVEPTDMFGRPLSSYTRPPAPGDPTRSHGRQKPPTDGGRAVVMGSKVVEEGRKVAGMLPEPATHIPAYVCPAPPPKRVDDAKPRHAALVALDDKVVIDPALHKKGGSVTHIERFLASTFREKLIRSGPVKWGIRALRQYFIQHDKDNDGGVTQKELENAIMKAHVTPPKEDVHVVMQAFPLQPKDGGKPPPLPLVDYNKLLLALRRPPSKARDDLIFSCWECALKRAKAADPRVKDEIPIQLFEGITDVTQHPSFEAHHRGSHRQVFSTLNSLLKGFPTMTQRRFFDFYHDVGAAYARESEFEKVLKGMYPKERKMNAKLEAKFKVEALPFPSPNERKKLFQSIDVNGNGMLSLAELDKAVVSLWPKFNNKEAIRRAYKLADSDRSGFVRRGEFKLFLKYLVYYNELWLRFQHIDIDGDRRLTLNELRIGKDALGLGDVDDFTIRQWFDEADTNRGGFVLFEEFAILVAKKRGDAEMTKDTNEF